MEDDQTLGVGNTRKRARLPVRPDPAATEIVGVTLVRVKTGRLRRWGRRLVLVSEPEHVISNLAAYRLEAVRSPEWSDSEHSAAYTTGGRRQYCGADADRRSTGNGYRR